MKNTFKIDDFVWWDSLYRNDINSKDVIGDTYPFSFLYGFGTQFDSKLNDVSKLKTDEELMLKKASKRVNKNSLEDYTLRWDYPAIVFLYEKSNKFKLWHGLFKRTDYYLPIELTWITINDKVIDFVNDVKGIIPDDFAYYGIEIPKEVAREALIKGWKPPIPTQEYPIYTLKPHTDTIFIKSFNNLSKFYGHTNGKNHQNFG